MNSYPFHSERFFKATHRAKVEEKAGLICPVCGEDSFEHFDSEFTDTLTLEIIIRCRRGHGVRLYFQMSEESDEFKIFVFSRNGYSDTCIDCKQAPSETGHWCAECYNKRFHYGYASVQCHGVTKAGIRCGRWGHFPYGYCPQHFKESAS